MSEVTGPISTLPGTVYVPKNGEVCDKHPDRPAAGRMQGETDSFGAELHDLCAECLEKSRAEHRAYREACKVGRCEWCGQHAEDLRQRRDFEEGMCGRIYEVCGKCVTKDLAAFDDDGGDYLLGYHEDD